MNSDTPLPDAENPSEESVRRARSACPFREFFEWNDEKLILFAFDKKEYVFLFIFEMQEYPGYYKEYIRHLGEEYKDWYTFIEGKEFSRSEQWTMSMNEWKSSYYFVLFSAISVCIKAL